MCQCQMIDRHLVLMSSLLFSFTLLPRQASLFNYQLLYLFALSGSSWLDMLLSRFNFYYHVISRFFYTALSERDAYSGLCHDDGPERKHASTHTVLAEDGAESI